MNGIYLERRWSRGLRICGVDGRLRDAIDSDCHGGSVPRCLLALGDMALKTPRNGVPVSVASDYLESLGWQKHSGYMMPLDETALPMGIVVVHVSYRTGSKSHMCAIIDRVVHDTWNPSEEDAYVLAGYWTPPPSTAEPALIAPTSRPQSASQELNQQQFEKILKRLRALDNTASNSASTEGEKHNALRMMQDLMLRHNLTREDIVDDDNVEAVQFTRRACPLNSSRACTWEVMLAGYVTRHIFPMVQYYTSTRGHRTLFWFYGPRVDVDNCIALFQELLLTIATSARLQYGGYSRGSGASYCEGYVSGLPIPGLEPSPAASGHEASATPVGASGLIQTRTLALQQAAHSWLNLECNVHLVMSGRSGRGQHDPAASSRGRAHGASHEIKAPGSRKRLN